MRGTWSVAVVLAVAGCSKAEPEMAELVFTDGTVHLTVDETADTLAIIGGVVVATGAEASDRIGEDTEVVELGGSHVYPGFQDAHVHLVPGSFVLDRLLMIGASSMSSIVDKVADYAPSAPDEPWIVGYGWLPSLMEEEPSGTALDAAVSDRPVILVDNSGHSALVNSVAMDLAGIDEDTPDPPGGEIVRDAVSGAPTGWLKEEALSLVSELALAAYDDELLGAGLVAQLAQFSQAGITGIADIMASPGFGVARPWIYGDLEANGQLPLRVHYYTPIFGVEDVVAAADYRDQYDTDLIRFSGGKVWVDGSISTAEAWTSEPWIDDASNYGSHYFESTDLTDIVAEAEAHGVPLKVHANGDAAVGATLDAFEAAASGGGLRLQHVIEHAVLVSGADMARMAALGVVASLQPVHQATAHLGDAPDAWGDERFALSYDFRGLVDAGVPIAMGTDWPVWPTVDPLVNVWGATQSDHALTAVEALRGYTEGSARSVGRSDLGTLRVDSRADLVIIDIDPATVDPAELTLATIEAVYVDGRKVK